MTAPVVAPGMTPGSAAEQVRRDGVWISWAPSGWATVPAIVLLVIVANLVGVATVVLLLVGIEDGSGSTGRGPVLLVVAAYLAVALPVGIVAGLRRQRTTNRWLTAGREPTGEEAGQALRLPGGHRPDRRAHLAGRRRRGRRRLRRRFPGSAGRAADRHRHPARRPGHRRRHLPARGPRRPCRHRHRAGRPPARRCADLRCPAAAAVHVGPHQRRPDARRGPALRRPEQPRRTWEGGGRLPRRRRVARGRAGDPADRPGRRAAVA